MLSIDTNSDIDNYKESIVAGLSLKETLWAGLGILSVALTILVLTMIVHIPLMFSIYIASPVAVPFILTGFFEKDGMNFWQRVRRKQNKKLSRPLSYVSTECREFYQKATNQVVLSERQQDDEFDQLVKRMKLIGKLIAVFLIAIILIIVIVVL